MNKLQRAIAAMQGKIIIPDTHVLLPAPPHPDQGWVLITTKELETIVMDRAKAAYKERTGTENERWNHKKFMNSEEFRNARLAIRNAINGTDPKNG